MDHEEFVKTLYQKLVDEGYSVNKIRKLIIEKYPHSHAFIEFDNDICMVYPETVDEETGLTTWERWIEEQALTDANGIWDSMSSDERVDWLLNSGASATCYYEWLQANGLEPD